MERRGGVEGWLGGNGRRRRSLPVEAPGGWSYAMRPRSPGARGEPARRPESRSRRGLHRRLVRPALAAAAPALAAAALLLPSASSGQQGPYPVFTEAHLDATMTTLGPNVAGVRATLAAGDYSTAKERAIRSREQLATTITFWRDRDRDDAVGWLRTALDRLDALDTALAVESVDAAAAVAIGDEVAEACNACHAVYREPDGDGGYRVNASALP